VQRRGEIPARHGPRQHADLTTEASDEIPDLLALIG
jgi:hypothetical protein